MLIIAIPKSASTSLTATLSELHGLRIASAEVRSQIVARCPEAAAFRQIANFHRREVVELDARAVAAVSAPGAIVKFHFPPTENNQARLRDLPKLILLRNVEEIVSAYRRGDETGAFRLKSHEFCYCLSEQGWFARAEKFGLLAELRAFAAEWRAHDGDKLVVESAELIADPAAVLGRVESYFGLPSSGGSTLRREKFSRGPEPRPRSPLEILFARRVLIAKRLASDLRKLATGVPL